MCGRTLTLGAGRITSGYLVCVCALLLTLTSCQSLLIEMMPSKRRQAYVDAHPNLSGNMERAILYGDVHIGMTAEQVVASIGRPERVNRTVTAYGSHEQWVYGWSYIYFRNGVVTSWQD